MAKKTTKSKQVSNFLPTLTDEAAIKDGISSINMTLFKHAITESNRIPKVRENLNRIEEKLMDKDLDKLTPFELTLYHTIMRKSLYDSTGFLERLHKLSLNTYAILELIKELDNRVPQEGAETSQVMSKAEAVAIKSKVISILAKRTKNDDNS